MSHYMTALAMQQRGLKPAAKIVLYWLADHHNGETGLCFPTLKTLAAEAEMDKATVVRQLEGLEAAGLIERVKRTRENGSRTSSQYTLNLTKQAVAKCNSPLSQNATAPVAKCATHNLGKDNLGNKNKKDIGQIDDFFARFWQVYPRKVGKGHARKAFEAALKKAHPETIISATEAYAQTRQGEAEKFTPHPATWLNGERWADTVEASHADFHSHLTNLLKGSNDVPAIRNPRETDRSGREQFSLTVYTTDEPDACLGGGGDPADF